MGKANTMATLTEVPDRELLGLDVIWCGNDEDGFLSSHRILSTANHAGGALGPSTGRIVAFRTIADTFCRANKAWDEWLIRDSAAIATQSGTSAKDAAHNLIDAGDVSPPLTPATDEPGPYAGYGNRDEWDACHSEVLHHINQADFGAVKQAYDCARHLSLTNGQEAFGWVPL